MEQQKKKLGEYLYQNLENNAYLKQLMAILTKEYALWLSMGSWQLTSKQKNDLLRFADLLVKSISPVDNNNQKNTSLRIIGMLSKMYPDDPKVKLFTDEVLTTFQNFLPHEEMSYEFLPTLDHLWNDAIREEQKLKRRIPGQEDQKFIGKQDVIYQSLGKELNSFSAPTSMGKTFLIEKYIEFQVKSGIKGNFAITVPSKALITEVKSQLIEDLGKTLNESYYRIISHPEEYVETFGGQNFIYVMTPERLSVLIAQNSNLRLAHLFIDESQKVTETDSRSIFYYEIFDQISKWECKPKITFASPLVPNPGVFKKIVNLNDNSNGIRITESPVAQIKFILDVYQKNLLVYDDLNRRTSILESVEKMPSIPQFILGVQHTLNSNCTLVYYGSKTKAISDAVVVSRELQESNNTKLQELADYVSRKIHPDYILVKLIRKGIAFHTGELPINVRMKLEKACREEILKFVFCTSTLLEGVNLPADNLIVTTLQNGKRKLSRLDFFNLIGRVGRLGHSMIGNVFLVTGEKEKSRSNLKAYLTMLNGNLEKVKLSVETIKANQIDAVKDSLKNGDVSLEKVSNNSNYDLIRKLSLLYVKEIKDNRQGVVRKHFSKKITSKDEKEIMQTLRDRYADKLEDDINFSSDQSEKLREKISEENIQGYPEIRKEEKLNLPETKAFFFKLSDTFNWSAYEAESVGAKEKQEIQDQIIDDYAKLTLLWIGGYSLKEICDFAITIRKPETPGAYFLNRTKHHREEILNIDWNTRTINLVMRNLQKIQFVLGKYFQKVSQELTKSGLTLKNDWYRFLEYGTDSDIRIWLQKNGYSRESSEFIEQRSEEFIRLMGKRFLISSALLKAEDVDVVSETSEVMVNNPEIFI